MSRVRVKICGLTSERDARAAADAGADAIGMVFWPASARARTPEQAAAIARSLPPFIARVGVFVNESPARVRACVSDVGLTAVQLHGDEDVEAYRTVGVPLLRAMSVVSDMDVARALATPDDVTLLIDAHDPARRGGTGMTASWTHAAAVAARRPIVLAGGLTPFNVAEAIRVVRPWAVDVSSGVECGGAGMPGVPGVPGVKDERTMQAFVAAVRSM